MRLLADKAVEIGLVEPVLYEMIRSMLKKGTQAARARLQWKEGRDVTVHSVREDASSLNLSQLPLVNSFESGSLTLGVS